MISHPANHRPTGHTPIQAPQPLVPASVLLTHPRQIGRWRKHAQSAKVLEREFRFETSIELAWAVVVRPDGVVIHADRHHVARKTHFRPRPSPTLQIMCNLPWADPADHREHERAAGPEQASTFAGHFGKIGNAIERAKIRVRAV